MRGTTKIGIAVAVGVVLLFAGVTGFRYITADARGAVDAHEKIKSGDNRIAEYDRFFDLCSAALTTQDQIDNLEEEKETAEEPRLSQLTSSITALKGKLSENVNDYNSAASRDYTSGQFRDSDLPYQLGKDREIKCATN